MCRQRAPNTQLVWRWCVRKGEGTDDFGGYKPSLFLAQFFGDMHNGHVAEANGAPQAEATRRRAKLEAFLAAPRRWCGRST